MKCPYCDTEFELDTLRQFDETVREDQPDHLDWKTESQSWDAAEAQSMATYVCNSCGGEIIAEASAAATFCPSAGTPSSSRGTWRVSCVPIWSFRSSWTKSRHCRHGKALVRQAAPAQGVQGREPPAGSQGHLRSLRLYDADCETGIRFRATQVRTWSSKDYIYTETSHYAVFRRGSLSFEHVPVDGSTRIPNDLMESIEPFDYRDAVDFRTAYLSGFFADRYNESATDCEERANERIKNSTRAAVISTVTGYSSIVPEHVSVRMQAGKTLYALLPVRLLTTKWNGQTYTFAMNGQTGKFVGNLPLDKAAYHKWLWGLTAAVSAGIIGLSYLIHLLA